MNLDELAQEERRQFKRKLVLLFHAICMILPATLPTDLDLSHFAYWRRGADLGSVMLATPRLLPYVISAVHSWRTAPYSRTRTATFLLILISATAAVVCALTGAFGITVGPADMLWICHSGWSLLLLGGVPVQPRLTDDG